MKRYRAEIVLFVCVLALCLVAVRAFSQKSEAKPPAAAVLKPGDEVKPLELEAAKLGKLKAQLQRDDAQENLLQLQFSNLEADKRTVQATLDSLVKEISERVKKETGAELVYDPRTGEDGTFHVNSLAPAPPAPTPAPKINPSR